MKKQFYFLDWGRAISILFVMMMHMDLPPSPLEVWGSSFAVAFFFFCSGFLVQPHMRETAFPAFARSRAQKLLLPYLVFGGVYLLNYLGFYLISRSEKTMDTMARFFHTFPLGNQVPLWFLPALFWVSLISYPAFKSPRRGWMLALAAAAFLALGYGRPHADYFDVFRGAFAFVFFFAGIMLRASGMERLLEGGYLLPRLGAGVLLVAFSAWSVTACLGKTSFYHFDTGGYPILYLCSAFAAIFGVCAIFSAVPSNPVVHWVSRNVIIVFGMHIICYSLIRKLSAPFFDLEKIAYWQVVAVYVVCTLLMCVPIQWVLAKALPWIFKPGNRPKTDAASREIEAGVSRGL